MYSAGISLESKPGAVLVASFDATWAFSTLVLQCQILLVQASFGTEKNVRPIREARHTRLYIFDGPQGSVTIEFSLVTFWQLTETFHEQSIAKQD